MNAPAEKLVGDTRVLAADVKELVKATAAQSGEKLAAARVRLQVALENAKETVALRTKETAQVADQYVHQNPWKAVGVSAGLGLLVGLLVGRR